ncbi:MAG: aminotransferase class I/II-fold pyridoxal phosphate-dependent enzyme [Firmicutes bacterium]|nr:aminotransferase class I/II-fold pyridoxal phosphate-dependent enzyme [Bacillota bacterium]
MDYTKTIYNILENEKSIIKQNLNMIASSSIPFRNVLDTQSEYYNYSPFEGHVGKRYFPKSKGIDDLEIIGESLAKKFFNISSNTYKVTLEPYSGTQANQIVYNAILNKDDYVLSMTTSAGGHVSHDHYIKKFYNLVTYSLNVNSEIDYEEMEMKCEKYKPKLIIAGSSSYPRMIDYEKISRIAKRYDCLLLADISHTAVYIATGLHISPFDHADFITMTTHKTTRGIRGGLIFYKKEYHQSVLKSIFPITQGAPKLSDIIAKVVMFDELLKMDIRKFVTDILLYKDIFYKKMKKLGFDFITDGSDLHFLIMDLSRVNISGKEAEERLAKNNILVNRNLIPGDIKSPFITSGIRIGFLTIACLSITKSDFEEIIEIFHESLLNHIDNDNKISKILSQYLQ